MSLTRCFPCLSLWARAAGLATLAALAATAGAHDLTVEVLNARSAQGTVDGALYDDAATWLKTPRAGERQPAAERVLLVYRGLPAGRYALSVFHDENGNGKLDSNVAGVPTERYGFSRDARGHFSAPDFDAAAVDLQGDASITIHLR